MFNNTIQCNIRFAMMILVLFLSRLGVFLVENGDKSIMYSLMHPYLAILTTILISKLSLSLCYRPGILADVTDRIARKGMSLEDVTTSIRLSSTGQREFIIDVLASSPNMKDKENLDQYLADITSMEKDLKLSHLDIRVHTG